MIERDRISLVVSNAQAGDEHAFAALVRAYQDRAVAYAIAILGDYHLAEDALTSIHEYLKNHNFE